MLVIGIRGDHIAALHDDSLLRDGQESVRVVVAVGGVGHAVPFVLDRVEVAEGVVGIRDGRASGVGDRGEATVGVVGEGVRPLGGPGAARGQRSRAGVGVLLELLAHHVVEEVDPLVLLGVRPEADRVGESIGAVVLIAGAVAPRQRHVCELAGVVVLIGRGTVGRIAGHALERARGQPAPAVVGHRGDDGIGVGHALGVPEQVVRVEGGVGRVGGDVPRGVFDGLELASAGEVGVAVGVVRVRRDIADVRSRTVDGCDPAPPVSVVGVGGGIWWAHLDAADVALLGTGEQEAVGRVRERCGARLRGRIDGGQGLVLHERAANGVVGGIGRVGVGVVRPLRGAVGAGVEVLGLRGG